MATDFKPVLTYEELSEKCKGKPYAYRRRMWRIICMDYYAHQDMFSKAEFARVIGCNYATFWRNYTLFESHF